MKAVLEFQYPEDEDRLRHALHGSTAIFALDEVRRLIRSWHTREHSSAASSSAHRTPSEVPSSCVSAAVQFARTASGPPIAATNRSSSAFGSLSVGSTISVPFTGQDMVGAWNP